MATEILTFARLRELFEGNPVTGCFTRRVRTARCNQVGDVAGSLDSKGYVRIEIDGKGYRAHRLMWLYVHGVWPLHDIDHKNFCRSDNRLENLRPATKSENAQNRSGAQSNSRSGILGVTWVASRQRWAADLVLNGKRMHHSYHDTFEAACAARRAAEIKWFPFSQGRRA